MKLVKVDTHQYYEKTKPNTSKNFWRGTNGKGEVWS